uniref:Elongation of very long chain fatty acids protein n=2 Tax=Cyanistes caeruleus TaxID=156563 RepID=A0A8C0ZA21_CYACU
MASTWQKTQEFYNWILESGDARTDPWPLVYSPLPVTLIFTSYLFMVALGPSYMRQRQRLELRALLLTYNLAMVALSSYMFYEFLVTSVLANYSYLCQPVDYSRSELGMRMARVCWWFFFSKIIELLDTVSFCNVNELSGLCLAGRRKLCPSLKLHSSLGCFLNSAQETRAGDFSARVPSWLYALQLVVRGQIRAWRTSLLYWDAELLCPHLHVWLLRPGRPGTADAQAPVVEALPDHPAAVPAGSHCCSFFLQPLHRVPIP